MRLGAKAKDLAGQPVVIKGYMAPPLVDEGDFFVMTRAPVVTCPFCDFGSSWPDDIVLTQLEKPSGFVEPFQAIEVAGVLDLGAKPDARTGATRLAAGRCQLADRSETLVNREAAGERVDDQLLAGDKDDHDREAAREHHRGVAGDLGAQHQIAEAANDAE